MEERAVDWAGGWVEGQAAVVMAVGLGEGKVVGSGGAMGAVWGEGKVVD